MSLEEIDHFLQKSTILQQTIHGLADGSINEDEINLKEYGIFTLQQQKDEDERRAKAKKEFERKVIEKNKAKHEEEKKLWWKSATYEYGPRGGLEEVLDENSINKEQTRKDSTEKPCHEDIMAIRYSSNYSRWSDSAYIPSDDATKEEKLHQKRLLEEQQNEEFEKANTAWCEQIKGDMKKREEGIKEKEKSAISLRLKGNKLFQRKKYADALVKYFEALEKTPFALNILTNIALVYEKLNHWEQSIEYCSRAIHINKTCTKALFLRHKALLQLDDNQGALGDLNKCVAFDPDNEVFSHAQTKLSLKLHNDRLQSEVVAIINSNTNNFRSSSAPIVSSSMSCVPNLTLENIRFIVTSEKDDSDHSSMIKKQCQYVDQCMDTLQYYGLNFKACDIFPALSLQPHLTICKVFVLEKLCKCSYACAYMRVAGYMSGLFQRLACFCRSYEEGLISEEKENLEKKREIIELISMLVYVMKSDVATRSFVADHFEASQLFDLFLSKIKIPKDVDLVASFGHFITGCFNINWETHAKFSSLIQKDDHFVHTLCARMKWCSNQSFHGKATSSFFSVISACANILTVIATCAQLKRKILQKNSDGTNDLIECLLSSVQMKGEKNKSCTVERSEMRRSILESLLAFSAIDEIREHYLYRQNNKNSTDIVQVLLALSNSFKSEFEITREMALLTLTNILIPIKKYIDIQNHIVGDIVAYGGIGILTHLCTNGMSSLSVKHRSSGLLSRLVLSPVTRLNEKDTNKIWKEFLSITSHKYWTNVSDTISSQSTTSTANNLLKLLISSAHFIKWSGTNDVHTIVKLLPKPRTNTKGEVDSQSVCQPPDQPKKGSAMAFASKTHTFHANLSKLLICYLDSSLDNFKYLIEAQGIEYIVCLIANSCNQHPITTKNAASVLARLVKGSEVGKQRCRDLRGMEILIELGKAGRI